jgi:hypothetical protein
MGVLFFADAGWDIHLSSAVATALVIKANCEGRRQPSDCRCRLPYIHAALTQAAI